MPISAYFGICFMPGFAWYLHKMKRSLSFEIPSRNRPWKTRSESVTSSSVLPRHEHIPMPVTTTRRSNGVASIRNCEDIAVRGNFLVNVREPLRRPFEASKAAVVVAEMASRQITVDDLI